MPIRKCLCASQWDNRVPSLWSKNKVKKQDSWERFLSHVQVQGDGCWMWLGSVTLEDYGRFNNSPYSTLAHRFSYEYTHGLVPKDLHLDHLCRIRRCVNPAHLEPVTPKENRQRTANILPRKTYCKRGHLLKGQNIGFYQARKTRPIRSDRYCKPCNTLRSHINRVKRRTALARLT